MKDIEGIASDVESEDSWANELLNQDQPDENERKVTKTEEIQPKIEDTGVKAQSAGKITESNIPLFIETKAEMIQDEMKTLEDKTNLLLDDLVVGSSSKIFQPDENKDSCDGSFSPNVCKIDEKKSSTGEDIEDLNNVSKNLNRINQDTYLLDPEGNQLTPEERKVANHVYDILQWS